VGRSIRSDPIQRHGSSTYVYLPAVAPPLAAASSIGTATPIRRAADPTPNVAATPICSNTWRRSLIRSLLGESLPVLVAELYLVSSIGSEGGTLVDNEPTANHRVSVTIDLRRDRIGPRKAKQTVNVGRSFQSMLCHYFARDMYAVPLGLVLVLVLCLCFRGVS
jgi:hypothetical protein